MSEFLRQIEALKGRDKSGKNIFATSDPGTGDITIHRYVPLIGPKRESPCMPRLHTMFTFNPESASSNAGIDFSQILARIPEDNTLEDSRCGFETFMADLVATHTKLADTWLGAVKRDQRSKASKDGEKLPVVEDKVQVTAGFAAVTVTVVDSSSPVSGNSSIENSEDAELGDEEKHDRSSEGNDVRSDGTDEYEKSEEHEEEEDDWKPPTAAEICQRMYREINDVYKRRNAAAVSGKWQYWQQYANAEIIMRVRHIWWMDVSSR